jgi:hypothetical protein
MGFLIGCLLSAVSWAGNVARTDSLTVSVFPDVMSAFVLPVTLYFVIRTLARRDPSAGLSALRRLGWVAVNTAAAVFAIFTVVVNWTRLSQADSASVTMALIGALVTTAGLGYISVEVWARSRTHVSEA